MYITLVVFSFKKLNQREYMYEKVEKNINVSAV